MSVGVHHRQVVTPKRIVACFCVERQSTDHRVPYRIPATAERRASRKGTRSLCFRTAKTFPAEKIYHVMTSGFFGTRLAYLLVFFMCTATTQSLSVSKTRRALLTQATAAVFTSTVPAAWAAADCFLDCQKNCKLIAPKDPLYCQQNCRDYCEQPDRTDGLSGSVSSSSGEVGILGGTFGQGTVVKGEDKPPSLSIPGLDFSSPTGRKLLGY